MCGWSSVDLKQDKPVVGGRLGVNLNKACEYSIRVSVCTEFVCVEFERSSRAHVRGRVIVSAAEAEQPDRIACEIRYCAEGDVFRSVCRGGTSARYSCHRHEQIAAADSEPVNTSCSVLYQLIYLGDIVSYHSESNVVDSAAQTVSSV